MLGMRSRLAAATVAAFALFSSVNADIEIYTDDALAAGWENWSWSTTYETNSTTLYEGTSSMYVVTDAAWGALSLKYEGNFSTYAGLRFDVAGDVLDNLQLYIQSTVDGSTGATIPFTALGLNFSSTSFTTVTIDFSALPGTGTPLGNATWDRINWQGEANGATYYLDNVVVLSEIVITPKFLSAEPITSNTVAVTTQGAVDLTTLKVTLNNKTVAISSQTTTSPVDAPSKSITYLTLASTFAAGSLVISAGNTSFTYTLPAVIYGSVTTAVTTSISPLIYGVNFAPSAAFKNATGITLTRWGGNAVTAYNPNKDVTNAGNDWYFENRNSDNGNADTWIGNVHSYGASAILTVPALDWVSKDNTSYSYSATVYPGMDSVDPYNPDRGDGQINGTWVTPNANQTNAYEPWNTTLGTTWLKGLKNPPEFAAIDNELEITSNTHHDMHPVAMSFDQELSIMTSWAKTIRSALPNVKIMAPTVCNWWFYWTSEVGYTDNAAHYNMDFLPWFLQSMKNQSTAYGKNLMDYLDVHYYSSADFSAGDAASKALYLRMTREWWDPQYIDESYIGTTTSPPWNEPNPNSVWLIPRLKLLVAQYFPGLKTSLSEWSAMGNEGDITGTGGLFAADSLGIFGVNGLDAATYWWFNAVTTSNPVALSYWLYRGYGTTFGDLSVQFSPGISLSTFSNTYGFYAGKDSSGGKLSFVFINKDVKPVSYYISNIPTGNYFLRHFGGQAGLEKWQTTISVKAIEYMVIPAYTAVFLKQV